MLTKEEIEKKYPGKKLEDIKVLNFYGNDFSNIDIISKMKSLKIISLSSNKISSLKPFENLQNLKELIIRNNNIENVDEIDYLKNCDKLNSLWLEENPVCKKEEYKEHLVKTLPNLKNLDNTSIIEIKEEIEKNKNENGINKGKSKEKTNKTITYNEDKLEDLLLDYEKENNIEPNEDNKENNDNKKEDNNKNNLLGSKSDIFKSEFINKDETNNKETEIPTKENSEINKTDNNNNKITESNKESKSSLGFSKIQMGSIVNEPNSDLLSDILRNVDTSQSIIRKNNSNPVNPKSSNLNNLNNKNTNINPEDPKEKMNINSNLTKNLNDLLKDVKLGNNKNNLENQIQYKNNDTEINNILNNVDTSQTIVNKNDKDINNILNNVDTSQTIDNKKDKEIKNILNDVETSQTILNKKDKEINNILKNVETTNPNFSEFDLNNDKNKNNFQSIDDIRKMFNNDYKPNGMNNISNIYGNNNIRDTKINNIFKSEMITSDSFSRNSSSKQNGPYKPDFNIPNNMQNYNYYGYENQNYNQNPRRNYNIKPSHEHKINAITNLLEDLNFENLLIVKNHIINKLNGLK